MRFAVITDTHYSLAETTADSTLWNRQLLTRSRELGARLAERLIALKPDFIIHAGDLTHDGDAASLTFAREVLNAAGVPVYCTAGNHDTVRAEGRSEIKNLFSAAQQQPGSQGLSYRFSVGALHFLVLDTNFAHLDGGVEQILMDWRVAREQYLGVGPCRRELAWFDEQLKGMAGERVVVVAHHPFLSKDRYPRRVPREPADPALRMTAADAAWFPHLCGQLRAISERNAPAIHAVLSGHWHINDALRWNDFAAIQTASLTEYPFEFRLFELRGKQLHGRIENISDEQLDALSIVPEWQNTWVRGSAADRDVRIDLR